MDNTTKTEILAQLKTIIRSIVPMAVFVEKYGGVVVEKERGNAATQFCGLFAYKNHVSLEFTNGAELEDPDNLLEGGGKHRRHLKMTVPADIHAKRCEDFLAQASRV